MVPVNIKNPEVTVNGQRIVFPVKMESGMVIEFNSMNDCKLYGSKGELIREVKVEGTIPSLVPGENEVSFSCNGPENVNSRVQITMISKGDPVISGIK
jgi:hypothetical protein